MMRATTAVIEVMHIQSGQRVSIQPNIVEAHKSVGTIALEQNVYEFRRADLEVVWILWRDGQDYDESDELLVVSDTYEQVRDLLDRFKSESYRYSISCAEINDQSAALSYLASNEPESDSVTIEEIKS